MWFSKQVQWTRTTSINLHDSPPGEPFSGNHYKWHFAQQANIGIFQSVVLERPVLFANLDAAIP
jgi:hypothetical protein